jgi:hypothetical protein
LAYSIAGEERSRETDRQIERERERESVCVCVRRRRGAPFAIDTVDGKGKERGTLSS